MKLGKWKDSHLALQFKGPFQHYLHCRYLCCQHRFYCIYSSYVAYIYVQMKRALCQKKCGIPYEYFTVHLYVMILRIPEKSCNVNKVVKRHRLKLCIKNGLLHTPPVLFTFRKLILSYFRYFQIPLCSMPCQV